MRTFAAQKPETMPDEVYVNYGRLLENDLLKFKGKHHHVRGLAEYISNSDDSYRRQDKFHDQEIRVELVSQRGRFLDEVRISDTAEGMSHDGFENEFFRYFESHSGRSEGKRVTGQFGTGGKAYAIMNFAECWITSVKDGKECKAWFKWDTTKKKIIKAYDKGGYIDKPVNKPNGTVIELLRSANSVALIDMVEKLNQIARIRHVIKNQSVKVIICKGKEDPKLYRLEYDPPTGYADEWEFDLPESLKTNAEDKSKLLIRYFSKPFSTYQAIDIQDGISSIVDIPINEFDDRPFNKYLTGEVVIEKLSNSSAVKENRKGLEEGDDLTVEIMEFLTEKIREVITEIQERQRQKEKERNIQVSSNKINELNKFLRKVELNFKQSLNELRRSRRAEAVLNDEGLDPHDSTTFRRPVDDDLPEDVYSGNWETVQPTIEGGGCGPRGPNNPDRPVFPANEVFHLDDAGADGGVHTDASTNSGTEEVKRKKGLAILMTDDPESPVEASEYGPYEEPVIDKFLRSDGIILINVNNPIIEKSRAKKELEHIFTERVANFVLLVVAQHQTEREMALRPEEERDDSLPVFRQKFFELQNDLRSDREISYFEDEAEVANDSISQ